MALEERVEERAANVLAAASGDRSRLRFLLEVGHELRTPAGIVAGYLEMARVGEIPVEDALDIAGTTADELCRLLDAMMRQAHEHLEQRETWRQRARAVHAQSEQLRSRTQAVNASARELLERLHQTT